MLFSSSYVCPPFPRKLKASVINILVTLRSYSFLEPVHRFVGQVRRLLGQVRRCPGQVRNSSPSPLVRRLLGLVHRFLELICRSLELIRRFLELVPRRPLAITRVRDDYILCVLSHACLT